SLCLYRLLTIPLPALCRPVTPTRDPTPMVGWGRRPNNGGASRSTNDSTNDGAGRENSWREGVTYGMATSWMPDMTRPPGPRCWHTVEWGLGGRARKGYRLLC